MAAAGALILLAVAQPAAGRVHSGILARRGAVLGRNLRRISVRNEVENDAPSGVRPGLQPTQAPNKVWVEADFAKGKIFGRKEPLIEVDVLSKEHVTAVGIDLLRSAPPFLLLTYIIRRAAGFGGDGNGAISNSISSSNTPYEGSLGTPARNITNSTRKLEGRWTKVEDIDQDEAMQMLGLSSVFRKGATLINAVDITVDDVIHIVTKGPLGVNIVEKYPITGEVVKHSRRDKRGGGHMGRLKCVDKDSATFELSWLDPHGGYLLETFHVVPSKTPGYENLEVISDIRVNKNFKTGESNPGFFRYKSIYERKIG